jgi:hypothetical protein
VRADPTLATARYNRGFLRQQRGDEAGAQEDFAAAKALRAKVETHKP